MRLLLTYLFLRRKHLSWLRKSVVQWACPYRQLKRRLNRTAFSTTTRVDIQDKTISSVFKKFAPIDIMQLKESSFWTSATSRSCDKKFFWCSGSEIPTDNKIHTWSPPNPNFVPGENCILHKFDFGSMVPIDGFEDNVCTGENLYLCEDGAATGGNTATNTSSRKFKIST